MKRLCAGFDWEGIGLKRRGIALRRSYLRAGRPGIFPFLADAPDQSRHPDNGEHHAEYQGTQHKPRPLVARALARLILFVHIREIISIKGRGRKKLNQRLQRRRDSRI